MDNIIKEMRKIIGDHDYNYINICICRNEIWFEVYETEVQVVVDLKKKEVYVDCEAICNHLTSDMLDELSKICKLIEDNLDVIEDLLKMN